MLYLRSMPSVHVKVEFQIHRRLASTDSSSLDIEIILRRAIKVEAALQEYFPSETAAISELGAGETLRA